MNYKQHSTNNKLFLKKSFKQMYFKLRLTEQNKRSILLQKNLLFSFDKSASLKVICGQPKLSYRRIMESCMAGRGVHII